MGMGRPTVRTDEVVATILERLAQGVPLTVICREGKESNPDFPAPRTVMDWKDADEQLSAAIARAREAGEEAILEECLTISNSPLEGVSEKYERRMIPNPDDPDGEQVEEFVLVERKVEDMLGHRKLQIETRLKLLAKFNPKRWGDYQRVDHDVVGSLADDLRAARERAKGNG